MATISINVTAGAQSTTVTKTVTNPDLKRFIDAMRTLYVVNEQPLTDAQVVTAWAEDVLGQARQKVRGIETAAVVKPSEIGMT